MGTTRGVGLNVQQSNQLLLACAVCQWCAVAGVHSLLKKPLPKIYSKVGCLTVAKAQLEPIGIVSGRHEPSPPR